MYRHQAATISPSRSVGNDPLAEIRARLGESVKSAGNGKWIARCPAHDDHNASLSLGVGGNGNALIYCHAGCSVDSITAAIGLTKKDLFPPKHEGTERRSAKSKSIVASYDYINGEDVVLFQAVRYEPKGFSQRRPDGKGGWIWNLKDVPLVLYRLPDLLTAQEDRPDDWRFIAEGEKDVDRLWREGLIATCNPMGAGKWRDEYSEILRGKRVCIIADKDKPGREHANQVAASLHHLTADVRIVECPGETKDASDFFNVGGSADQLLTMAESATIWAPTLVSDVREQSRPDESPDRATELANAEELHRRHGEKVKYHVARGEYFVWGGKHWQCDIDGQVDRWAKGVARSSSDRLGASVDHKELERFQKSVESSRGINGVLTLFQTELGISISSDRFDCDDFLLNVENGTLNLRTGELKPHSPSDMITHCLGTPYTADAKCPTWESVVRRSMGGNDDLIRYLQRWCGLFLTGSPNTHELLIAYGAGANGKSVIFDTLCGLLETYAGVAPESLLVARHGRSEHPTELASLFGKRLVIASETESGATLGCNW